MVKVISIQDDVYEALSKDKDKKSFSQVIRELLAGSRKETTVGDLSAYWGILSHEEAGILEDEVTEGRNRTKPRNIREV